MTIDFKKLRAANVARQDEWTGNEKADILFRALEVADEAGEVAGAVKKLVRAQRGICGSTLTLEDVADEIGDTVISLDLLACELGHELTDPAFTVQPKTDGNPLVLALAADWAVGQVSMAILQNGGKPYDRNAASAAPVIDEGRMRNVLQFLNELAAALGIDVGRAVAVKFNKTSAKYGLITMMEV